MYTYYVDEAGLTLNPSESVPKSAVTPTHSDTDTFMCVQVVPEEYNEYSN